MATTENPNSTDLPIAGIEYMVADILQMIAEDGLSSCPTFGDLHDHVDANEYLIEAIAAARANDLDLEAWLNADTEEDLSHELTLAARLSDLVDAHLRSVNA
jgi:hypothetical protein